jgi:hypothetical protein
MAKIKVTRKAYIRKDGTVVKAPPTTPKIRGNLAKRRKVKSGTSITWK